MSKITRSKPVSREKRAAAPVSAAKRAVGMADRIGATKTAARKPGEIDDVIAMMRRPRGATIADIAKLTDWQAHSVRGAISGTIKKKLGLKVVPDKTGYVRTYRITG